MKLPEEQVHDLSSGRFSLHRPVQAECLSRATTYENQEGFDEEGAHYLDHIASLARSWRDSQREPDPLKPTVDFGNLMADCAWFVHDNDTAGIMSLVIGTGQEAYFTLPDNLKTPLLESDILLLLCIRDLRFEGDFESAEQQGKKSLAIRVGLRIPQELELTNCYNYIAIACDSVGRHAEAKGWLQKSRTILEGTQDELHTRLLCQNNLNFSRNLFSVQDYEESEKLLDQACSQATIFESWYSLAFAHHSKANLYIRWGRYDAASEQVALARATLSKSGGVASISWASGIVSYRASSVAILQNVQEVAVDEAKKAVAIARLYKMPPGARARFSHLLMKAYLMDPEKYGKEASEARSEAQRLRKLLPPGRTDLSDESDRAFDLLVDISVR
ncbi:uncharacterized protein F5Z01DRAFT_689273 [Emericellopsis atlantica]|uniref:Uncharacterized protein n=1 Tax=Emericellopsis atlantica TaxID=2614577 RepID=A0A9P8CPV3_9HYPO|nr:uncharacterized protein F5Z01DRAFT_689273 [Emericellopsis atlantica]KAG9253126.1 hypothetical protein F5Z01DRAFT_689273 [Emericellopsis atlantica]